MGNREIQREIPASADTSFQLFAKPPQDDHVEKNVNDAVVQEARGEGLPPIARG